MSGPLEDVKVVDLSTWAAAPAACVILADWGADVIKIEHSTGGDPCRAYKGEGWLPECPLSPGWESDNRNKRSLALDLKKETAQKIAHQLVEKADVFVSNLPESALHRINMDENSLKMINSDLIYGHLTGYGLKGENNKKPGYDFSAFWASSGIMSTIGDPESPPAFQRPAMGDHVTALAFAAGICAALYTREKRGISQKVDISLMNTGIWTTSWQGQAAILSGQDIKQVSRMDMKNPLFNIYKTKDRSWFIFTMVLPDPFWEPLCRALSLEELIDDPHFNSSAQRLANYKQLIELMDKAIAVKDMAEWAEIFNSYKLIWAPVHTIKSALEDPQSKANDFVVEVDHPAVGRLKVVNTPVRFSKTPHQIKNGAPLLGQHNEDILLELGYSQSDINDLILKKSL